MRQLQLLVMPMSRGREKRLFNVAEEGDEWKKCRNRVKWDDGGCRGRCMVVVAVRSTLVDDVLIAIYTGIGRRFV